MTRNVLQCSLAVAFVAVAAGFTCVSAQDILAARDSNLTFALEIGNRNYPDWREEARVRLGETFYLGDSPFTARIERFVPDFRINDRGEVLHFSEEMNNPAAQVVVYGDSAATDTTWAFLNFPPHFSPRSFFAFKLLAVDGYEPASAAPPSSAAPGSTTAVRKEEDDG